MLVPSNFFCPSKLIHVGCKDSGVSLVSELSWCEFRQITNCLCQCFPGVPAADLFAKVPAEIILRQDISSRNLSSTQTHTFWCHDCSYRKCNVLFCVVANHSAYAQVVPINCLHVEDWVAPGVSVFLLQAQTFISHCRCLWMEF